MDFGHLHDRLFLPLAVEQFRLMVGSKSVDHGADIAIDEVVQIVTSEVYVPGTGNTFVFVGFILMP